MVSDYKVRIMRSEIHNIKNVSHGEITYMNYGSINRDAVCDVNDIVGIYGQNGSGKTALVESLDILRHILTGTPVSYDIYEGIISRDGSSYITTDFFVCLDDDKYKVSYQAYLKVDDNEKAIYIASERLKYWTKGKSWKSCRDISFTNPFYGSANVLETQNISVDSKHLSKLKKISFLSNMQNLALICAQKDISVFFNEIVKANIEKMDDDIEVLSFKKIILGILKFAYVDFNIIKINQLGRINLNKILAINIHKKAGNVVEQAINPLAMGGVTEIPEKDYEEVKSVINAINVAIKSIVPDLQIYLEKELELEHPDGIKTVQVSVYSKRGEKKFSLRYESEGIKRIISILNNLIAVYNNEAVCLVVDELDSSIYEYLLGELIGVMHRDMKGQLIFTSNNLRVLEKLDSKNIICVTTNPDNKYIRLKGIEKSHNNRDFYIRALTVGGQNEVLYDENNLDEMGYAFRKAAKIARNDNQNCENF